jgi:hypothetical protein
MDVTLGLLGWPQHTGVRECAAMLMFTDAVLLAHMLAWQLWTANCCAAHALPASSAAMQET